MRGTQRTDERMCVSDSTVRFVRPDMCARVYAAKEIDKNTEREGDAKKTVLNRDRKKNKTMIKTKTNYITMKW